VDIKNSSDLNKPSKKTFLIIKNIISGNFYLNNNKKIPL
jgi:hypothetical protein